MDWDYCKYVDCERCPYEFTEECYYNTEENTEKEISNMGNDAVKHPTHYAGGRKYEPKDVIRDWDLNFNLGNAVKYLARAGRKDDIVQDLKKAQEYIQFEIEAIEAEREVSSEKEYPTIVKARCDS